MLKPNNLEVWKPVPIEHFAPAYEVSNLGRVRSLNYRRQKIIKVIDTACKKDGYYYVNLYYQGKRLYIRLHKLVALAFLPPPLPGQTQINHLNGKHRNDAESLQWVTQSENIQHSMKEGLRDAGKPVEHVDKKGKIIKWYQSIKEASRETGVRSDYISRCCRGINNSANGMYFRFAYPWTGQEQAFMQKKPLKRRRSSKKKTADLQPEGFFVAKVAEVS